MSLDDSLLELDEWFWLALPENRLKAIEVLLSDKFKEDPQVFDALAPHKDRIMEMSVDESRSKLLRYLEIRGKTSPTSAHGHHPRLKDPNARIEFFLSDGLPEWMNYPVIIQGNNMVYTCEEWSDEDLSRYQKISEAICSRDKISLYLPRNITPEERREMSELMGKLKATYPRP
jgi:hypothetical protein